MCRALRFAFEAINRGDHEAAVLLYHPQGEFDPPAQVAGLGIASHTVGPEERVRLQDRWREEWGEFRVEPTELINAGGRLIALVRFETVGLSSGAGTNIDGAFVFTISAGRVIREQAFIDQGEALEAAGLSE
jgi:ketosteroid isomerase-like protein